MLLADYFVAYAIFAPPSAEFDLSGFFVARVADVLLILLILGHGTVQAERRVHTVIRIWWVFRRVDITVQNSSLVANNVMLVRSQGKKR